MFRFVKNVDEICQIHCFGVLHVIRVFFWEMHGWYLDPASSIYENIKPFLIHKLPKSSHILRTHDDVFIFCGILTNKVREKILTFQCKWLGGGKNKCNSIQSSDSTVLLCVKHTYVYKTFSHLHLDLQITYLTQ